MDSIPLRWLEMQRASIGYVERPRIVQLVRENVRLREENARLRQRCADLAASAELWIQLYEAALARANERGAVSTG